MGFLTWPFDTSGFPARWRCGTGWQETPWLGWLHIVSDLGVWSAYVAIPCVLLYFVLRKKNIPFRSIFLLFGAFILACGATHLMEAVIFWWPAYRLAGVIKLLTAIVSWATVFALIPVTPKVLAMRGFEELEREIAAREQAEKALHRTNMELERRVEERTRELMEAERRWRSLAEALPNLVWSDLPDGQCDYLSSQWETYTGIPVSELLGLTWLDRVIHPDDRQRTLDCWMAAVQDKGVYDLEYRIRRHDGQYHWFKTRGVPIRDDQGRIVKWFGTCTDIEDRKQSEAALRDADRRKDEFLATLAHELRNPLAPLSNSLQILRMPGIDPEEAQGLTEMMERQVHHLVRLVDDLLDVSRVMRGKIELRKERIDLAEIVARAVDTAQPLIEMRGHELAIVPCSETLLMEVDPVRMVQVLGNLLTNAARYTEEKGRIRVVMRRDGDRALLMVSDNGIGLAPHMLCRVFELFVQANQRSVGSHGGLGIGLTLVKNLVEMHGGTVVAHSDGLGAGSEFVVDLPLAIPTVEDNMAPAAVEQPPSPPALERSVLVVDDNRDAANTLAMLLRMQGHQVRVAHDGLSALEMATANPPELIFLDIGMPGMDGYELARQLRRQPQLEGVVLIALTGWGLQDDRRRSAEAGIDHHLVKPPERKAIEELLAAKTQ